MANRYEWLDRQEGDENPPAQYHAIIAALGDWIEAQLGYRAQAAATNNDVMTYAQLEALRARIADASAVQADAKRRAIEAGYVWRLDLDP